MLPESCPCASHPKAFPPNNPQFVEKFKLAEKNWKKICTKVEETKGLLANKSKLRRWTETCMGCCGFYFTGYNEELATLIECSFGTTLRVGDLAKIKGRWAPDFIKELETLLQYFFPRLATGNLDKLLENVETGDGPAGSGGWEDGQVGGGGLAGVYGDDD